ncbi:MAG: hypothetical protein ABSC19_19470 [Syntrophorhabdales bacterium]|jgi:hypothetical protein
MSKEIAPDISNHLSGLLDSSPSGVAKLIAAWDGLSTESQIAILTELDTARLPAYLDERLRISVLESPNAYVRYLAARGLRLADNNDVEKEPLSPVLDSKGRPIPNPIATRTVKQRIEDDPSPLVRYSLLENQWGIWDDSLKDPETFFALAHEARLAKVRALDGMGEEIASLISYAVDHHLKDGKVSEIELFEILSDFVNRSSFREHYSDSHWENPPYDGWGEYTAGKDIEALWKLVSKLPEGISNVLIEHLPLGAGLRPDIPESVLKEMTPHQLATLLYREDVQVRELRKNLFLRPIKDGPADQVLHAAVSCHLDLSYAEFAELLAKSERDKIDALEKLTWARDLNLAVYEATIDMLSSSHITNCGDGLFSWPFEQRIGRLEGWRRDEQLRELRLYRLARQSVAWKKEDTAYPFPTELDFLSKIVAEGNDTWTTFMRFSKSWASRLNTEQLEKHLPCIEEAGEKDYEEDDHTADNFAEFTKGLNEQLSTILAKINGDNEGESPTLAAALKEVTSYMAEGVGKSLEAIGNLRSELLQLRSIHNRQNFLLFVVIGLLVWLVLKRW